MIHTYLKLYSPHTSWQSFVDLNPILVKFSIVLQHFLPSQLNFCCSLFVTSVQNWLYCKHQSCSSQNLKSLYLKHETLIKRCSLLFCIIYWYIFKYTSCLMQHWSNSNAYCNLKKRKEKKKKKKKKLTSITHSWCKICKTLFQFNMTAIIVTQPKLILTKGCHSRCVNTYTKQK